MRSVSEDTYEKGLQCIAD